MQGRFKMEYRLFTIVRYNYRDYNNSKTKWEKKVYLSLSRNLENNQTIRFESEELI